MRVFPPLAYIENFAVLQGEAVGSKMRVLRPTAHGFTTRPPAIANFKGFASMPMALSSETCQTSTI